MNFTLTRTDFRPDGIFSILVQLDTGTRFSVTLEHSYENLPKLPDGSYTCVRGKHRLHGMTEDFETFEVTGVEGHSGILFHWGNYNKDSDGCILLGQSISKDTDWMVTHSRDTFAKFMDMLQGTDEFTLIVAHL